VQVAATYDVRRPAASQRSLQACIASLPLQSSWMSKTYLKSDTSMGVDHYLASIELFDAAENGWPRSAR
jgi:hypothetical protein